MDKVKTPATYYLLTKTDGSRVQGPIGLGWFTDFDAFARDPESHKFRENTSSQKVADVATLINVVLQLRLDWIKKQEDAVQYLTAQELKNAATVENDLSLLKKIESLKAKIRKTEDDIATISKIYTVAYSATRIRGWAIVFNIKDMKALCNDACGDFLPRSWCKSWGLQEKDAAVAWLNNEIELSNARIQSRKLLRAADDNSDAPKIIQAQDKPKKSATHQRRQTQNENKKMRLA